MLMTSWMRVDGVIFLNDLKHRALKWCKRNDGGRIHPKGDTRQFNVSWDHGGYHEIGCMYDGKTAVEDIELICEVFNWALEQLNPSTQSFYGERSYD